MATSARAPSAFANLALPKLFFSKPSVMASPLGATAPYNFGKSHRSLPGKITPAMAAGISSRFWTMEDVVALIDKREVEAANAAAAAKSAKPSGLVPVRRSAQIG